MEENKNEKPKTKAERRERIKARHSGLCADDVEYIPARERISFFDDNSTKWVIIYIRVSTDDEKQLTSFELQKSYYSEKIKNKPEWEFAGIYADEGKTGRNVTGRPAFQKMIKDCLDGKIDIIITKSV